MIYFFSALFSLTLSLILILFPASLAPNRFAFFILLIQVILYSFYLNWTKKTSLKKQWSDTILSLCVFPSLILLFTNNHLLESLILIVLAHLFILNAYLRLLKKGMISSLLELLLVPFIFTFSYLKHLFQLRNKITANSQTKMTLLSFILGGITFIAGSYSVGISFICFSFLISIDSLVIDPKTYKTISKFIVKAKNEIFLTQLAVLALIIGATYVIFTKTLDSYWWIYSWLGLNLSALITTALTFEQIKVKKYKSSLVEQTQAILLFVLASIQSYYLYLLVTEQSLSIENIVLEFSLLGTLTVILYSFLIRLFSFKIKAYFAGEYFFFVSVLIISPLILIFLPKQTLPKSPQTISTKTYFEAPTYQQVLYYKKIQSKLSSKSIENIPTDKEILENYQIILRSIDRDYADLAKRYNDTKILDQMNQDFEISPSTQVNRVLFFNYLEWHNYLLLRTQIAPENLKKEIKIVNSLLELNL